MARVQQVGTTGQQEVAARQEVVDVSGQVKSAEGFILNHNHGGPHHRRNTGRKINDALVDLSVRSGIPRFAELRPHELRATFITLSRQAGADERYRKRYVGHSPGDILGAHYEVVTVEDMRQRVVDVFLGAHG